MAEIGTTPNRITFASAGAVRRRSSSTGELAFELPHARPSHSELERARYRCIAELMVLRAPRRLIGNADRFDIDVASAVRDGGNTWQGCHMALVLREHGYVI